MTAHVSTFAYHLCRLSILRIGTSTFLHPGSVSQGYGHTKKGHVYVILEKIKPARWHLCRISPLLPWESWRSLPASGSLRPKPQAQTKKGGSYPWLGRASAASTTVREKHPWCQPHPPNMPFCKTSNLPSKPFGGSLALWLIRPLLPTEKGASTYPYTPSRASSPDLLPEHKWPFAASVLSPRHASPASPVCHDGPALAQSTGMSLSSLHSLQGPKHPLSRRHRNNIVSPLEYFCFGKVANKPMANAHLHTKRKVFVGLYTWTSSLLY